MDGAAGAALDPTLAVPQRHLHPGEVEVPPGAPSMIVDVRRSTHARRAVRNSGRRSDVDLDAGLGEPEAGHASLFQCQLAAE